MLYKALVCSHLEYANASWSPYKKCDIYVLKGVQRRATKSSNSIKHLTYENKTKKIKLPTLKYHRARGDMIEVFKILHCLILMLLQGVTNIKCIKVLSNMILESTFSLTEWCHYGIVCLMLL